MKYILLLAITGLLASCWDVDLNSDPSDVVTRGALTKAAIKKGENGEAKIVADAETVATWVSRLTRIVSGEDARDVILEKPKSGEGQK